MKGRSRSTIRERGFFTFPPSQNKRWVLKNLNKKVSKEETCLRSLHKMSLFPEALNQVLPKIRACGEVVGGWKHRTLFIVV